ncbi:arylamine N-acetyltransferase [Ilyonectria robusta]
MYPSVDENTGLPRRQHKNNYRKMDGLSVELPRLADEKVIAYLQHLGVPQVKADQVELPKPTFSLLCEMQKRHHDKIPFESVSVHLGKNVHYQDSDPIPYQEGKGNIDVSPNALFNKIVTRGMGGYCFELNGLFAIVLRSLGYTITNHSARVYAYQGKTPEDAGWSWSALSHQTTHVHFAEDEMSGENIIPEGWKAPSGGTGVTFHCDVGFGVGQPREPILINTETASNHHIHERLPPFREADGVPAGYTLYHKLYDNESSKLAGSSAFKLAPMYHYTEQPQLPVDYLTSNWFSNTWHDSIFVKMMVATMPFGVERGDPLGTRGRHSFIYSHHEALGARKEGDRQVAIYRRKGLDGKNTVINEERTVATFGEFKKLMWEVFGINTNRITSN